MMITRSSQLDGFLKTIRIKDDDHPQLPVGRLPENHQIKRDDYPQLPVGQNVHLYPSREAYLGDMSTCHWY
jgi:hypothetical protein